MSDDAGRDMLLLSLVPVKKMPRLRHFIIHRGILVDLVRHTQKCGTAPEGTATVFSQIA